MYVCTWLTRVVRRCGLLFSTLLDILWTRLMISSSSHLHTLSSYFPPFSLHKMMSYQRIESSLFQLSTCCGFEKPQKPFYAAARSGSHIITYVLLTCLLTYNSFNSRRNNPFLLTTRTIHHRQQIIIVIIIVIIIILCSTTTRTL